jgi:hypothetical protein
MVRTSSFIRHAAVTSALSALIGLNSAQAQPGTDLSYREFYEHFGVYEPFGSVIITTASISNVRDYFEHDMQQIFRDARTGMREYRFKVPNGIYRVHLYFAEIEKTSIGQRVFSVALQDESVVERLDIFAEVGANRAYGVISEYVEVSDGVLRLEFEPFIGEPLLSAISVAGDIAGARTSIERTFFAHMNCGGPQFQGFNPDFGT